MNDDMMVVGLRVQKALRALDDPIERMETLLWVTMIEWVKSDGTDAGMEKFLRTWEERWRANIETARAGRRIADDLQRKRPLQ